MKISFANDISFPILITSYNIAQSPKEMFKLENNFVRKKNVIPDLYSKIAIPYLMLI